MIPILISFIGLFAGFIILHYAPEEKKPGMKYFKVIERVTFALIFFYSLYVGLIIASFIYAAFYIILNKYHIYISYAMFSLFVLQDFIMQTMIFFYGLVAGAMLYEKGKILRLFRYSYFVIIAIIFL